MSKIMNCSKCGKILKSDSDQLTDCQFNCGAVYCTKQCAMNDWNSHVLDACGRAVILPTGASAAEKRGEGIFLLDEHAPDNNGYLMHILSRGDYKWDHHPVNVNDEEVQEVGWNFNKWWTNVKRGARSAKVYASGGKDEFIIPLKNTGGYGDESQLIERDLNFTYEIKISDDLNREYGTFNGEFYSDAVSRSSDSIGVTGREPELNKIYLERKELENKVVLWPNLMRKENEEVANPKNNIFYARQGNLRFEDAYVRQFSDNVDPATEKKTIEAQLKVPETQKMVITLAINGVDRITISMRMRNLENFKRDSKVRGRRRKIVAWGLQKELKAKERYIKAVTNSTTNLVQVYGYSTGDSGEKVYVKMLLEVGKQGVAKKNQKFVYIRDIELIVPVDSIVDWATPEN